ncbi:hypothetical protein D9M72_544370 [compost metagenome]
MNCEEGTFDVGIERVVKILLGDLAEGRECATACVGHEDIDATVFRADRLEKCIEFFKLGRIGAKSGRIFTDRLDGEIELGLPSPCNDNLGSLRDKSFGDGKSDAGASSGDDRDFSFKRFTHFGSF